MAGCVPDEWGQSGFMLIWFQFGATLTRLRRWGLTDIWASYSIFLMVVFFNYLHFQVFCKSFAGAQKKLELQITSVLEVFARGASDANEILDVVPWHKVAEKGWTIWRHDLTHCRYKTPSEFRTFQSHSSSALWRRCFQGPPQTAEREQKQECLRCCCVVCVTLKQGKNTGATVQHAVISSLLSLQLAELLSLLTQLWVQPGVFAPWA